MKQKKSQFVFMLSKEDRTMLEEAAELDEIPMSTVVRRAIREYWRDAKKRSVAERTQDEQLRAS